MAQVDTQLPDPTTPDNPTSQTQSGDPATRVVGAGTRLVRNIAIYFAAISATVAAVVLLWNRLPFLHGLGPWGIAGFVVVIVSPLLLASLFETIPAWRTRRAQDRLRSLASHGEDVRPGYFRLTPYEAADHDVFTRQDRVHDHILHWIHNAHEPILYLTGRSGTGKSSALASWVVPELERLSPPFHTVTVRTFANPLAELYREIGHHAMLPAATAERDPFRALEHLCSAHNTDRFLIIFDQFEEFLILNDHTQREAFGQFLHRMHPEPRSGLTVLLALRTDYLNELIAFMQDFALGDLTANVTHVEVGPFSRAAAAKFLDESGLKLGQQAREKTIDELSRLEDNPGLVRPITLNIAGTVLSTYESGAAERVPIGRLIESWLKSSISQGDLINVAPKILAKMRIEASGTKQPMSVAQLATTTGFDDILVRGCLIRLAQKGLVKRLQGETQYWEISHDFIANLLGSTIAETRPPIFQRIQSSVAPSALVSWAVIVVLALFVMQPIQQSIAWKRLSENPGIILSRTSRGYAVEVPWNSNFEALKSDLQQLKDISQLEVGYYLENETSLAGFSTLGALVWRGPGLVRDLHLLSSLEYLELYGDPDYHSLPPNLKALSIRAATGVGIGTTDLYLPTVEFLQITTAEETRSIAIVGSWGNLKYISVGQAIRRGLLGHGRQITTRTESENKSLQQIAFHGEFPRLTLVNLAENPLLSAIIASKPLPQVRIVSIQDTQQISLDNIFEVFPKVQTLMLSTGRELRKVALPTSLERVFVPAGDSILTDSDLAEKIDLRVGPEDPLTLYREMGPPEFFEGSDPDRIP